MSKRKTMRETADRRLRAGSGEADDVLWEAEHIKRSYFAIRGGSCKQQKALTRHGLPTAALGYPVLYAWTGARAHMWAIFIAFRAAPCYTLLIRIP